MAARKRTTRSTLRLRSGQARSGQAPCRVMREPQYAPAPQLSGFNFSKFLVPVLGGLLVLTSFMVGVLWTRLSYVQQGGGGAGCGESALDTKCIKSYAKEIKVKDGFWIFDKTLDNKQFNECVVSRKYQTLVNQEVNEGSGYGVTGTPATFVNGYLVSGAQPYDNFKRVIDFLVLGGDPAKPDVTVTDLFAAPVGAPEGTSGLVSATEVSIDTGNAPVLGNAAAPITIVEYSDFECPFCGRFYTQTLQSLKRDYVDTGKARFVYKQFPLTSIHPKASGAAEASLCAHEQGKFWEMHDRMFEGANASK
ncbi:MAG: thioredoxin domain-containing protein [Patescibacteria group bacterium]